MLPRRHIRIKVFQSLYTYSQQIEDQIFDIHKEHARNLNGYLNLYYLIIECLRIIHELAKEEIIIRKNKWIPNQEDLKPNKKFIKNKILKELKKTTTGGVDYSKLKSVLKNIFRNLKKSKTYLKYMEADADSYESEKKIIIYILTKYLVSDEKMHDFIEEYSIYWNDDLIIVYNHLIEKLKYPTLPMRD